MIRLHRAIVRCILPAALILAAAPAAAQRKGVLPADLILHNGRVVTLHDDLPAVEALAVRDGRIIDLGRSASMLKYQGRGTKTIDLEGRLAVPGFIESHGHFVSLGRAKMELDCTAARTWDDLVRLVADAAEHADDRKWIVGRGWHQEKWTKPPEHTVEGFPTHDDLSAAAPEHPVWLTHASGHAALANQRAMELAGVSGSTEDPPGGRILRDEGGAPTGVFIENAQTIVGSVASAARPRGAAQIRAAALVAAQECLSKGVTSFQDAGSSFAVIDVLRIMVARDELGVRLWMMVREPNDVLAEHLSRYAGLRRLGGGFLTVGGLKRTLDGALGSRGAWLLEPYADEPSSTGLATAALDDLETTARLALEHELQMCVHAIGDRANREVLDLYERIFDEIGGGRDLRWRIEHAQHLHPRDVPRFAELGVIAAMQGIHCTSDGPWVIDRLGRQRAESGAYVWRSLIDSGAVIANGTDAPVEDVDPIACFHASVSRRLPDGTAFFPEQSMSRMEALRSYTVNAARAAGEEDIKGSLQVGRLADVVVLSRDILIVPGERIPEAEVVYTIIGGEVVYESRER